MMLWRFVGTQILHFKNVLLMHNCRFYLYIAFCLPPKIREMPTIPCKKPTFGYIAQEVGSFFSYVKRENFAI